VSFAIAHDAEGKFRDALLVDNDPDYYVIDRAGQLRFADVATSSIEEAVRIVVSESATDAGNVQALIDQRSAARRAEQEKLYDINESLDSLRDIPDLPFAEPTPEDYERSGLPALSEEVRDLLGIRSSGRRGGNDEDAPPVVVSLPQEGQWLGGRPPNYKGRAVVLYFWHPRIRASYWPMMERMDVLQRQHARDIVVIGVMLPADLLDDDSRSRRRSNEAEETARELQESWNRFVASRKFDHTLYFDAGGEVIGSIGGSGRRSGTALINGVYVVSSDGVLRWGGFAPNREYQGVLDQVLRRDPAVRARREVEQRYIEGRR
jgi:hypothetical protein